MSAGRRTLYLPDHHRGALPDELQPHKYLLADEPRTSPIPIGALSQMSYSPTGSVLSQIRRARLKLIARAGYRPAPRAYQNLATVSSSLVIISISAGRPVFVTSIALSMAGAI